MKTDKLKIGDKVCIIAPSRSLRIISDTTINHAITVFNDMGLEVVFGKNVYEIDEFNSSSVDSRISDLHYAFSDNSIKAIFTAIGGFNSNQIIGKIDYKLIKKNPKILCGFSDITVLSNAIYKKTGLVTYSGPHFSSFGMEKGIEYTVEYFKKCLFSNEAFDVIPSKNWSDDRWFLNQEDRVFIDNDGPNVINPGKAEGTLIGGNLCTLNLLQGSLFMPDISGSILFLEDDELMGPDTLVEFDRNLQSIIHLINFDKVRGILIGRFQKNSEVTDKQLYKLIKSKGELDGIPVISNMNFGHTTPIITIPVGGTVIIDADERQCNIEILRY